MHLVPEDVIKIQLNHLPNRSYSDVIGFDSKLIKLLCTTIAPYIPYIAYLVNLSISNNIVIGD